MYGLGESVELGGKMRRGGCEREMVGGKRGMMVDGE